MFGMGELQVIYGSALAEEVTAGDTSCRIVIPCPMQLEGVGIVPTTKFGNTITTSAGIIFQRLSGVSLATSTILATLNLSGASTADLAVKAGDGERPGMTKVKGTKAWDVGEVITKMISPVQLKAGERVAVVGSATVGSATGDFVPFIMVRVAGPGIKETNVYSDSAGIPRLTDIV